MRGGMLLIHQKLIGWLSRSGGKSPWPSSTWFKGNHADFWFDSRIPHCTAMSVTKNVQRSVDIPMLIFDLWQRCRAADIVKCKPLTVPQLDALVSFSLIPANLQRCALGLTGRNAGIHTRWAQKQEQKHHATWQSMASSIGVHTHIASEH